MFKTVNLYCVFLQNYIKFLLSPIFNKIGNMENVPTTFEGVKFQSSVVSWACRYGVGNCIQQAQDLFTLWREEDDPDNNNP